MTSAAIQVNYVPVTYREVRPDDESFIYSSWLKSFRAGSTWAAEIPGQIYFSNHKKVIARLLGEAGVVVAANPEATDQIFGYGVYQPTAGGVTVLHYVYVKHPYRRLGIGSDMVRVVRQISGHEQDLPMVATHIANAWDKFRERWNVVYNPYVIGARDEA